MIAALIIGRRDSSGFPGKNVCPVLGRPLMAYPLLAAAQARHVDEIYCSTDSDEIWAVAEGFGARRIARPPELATKEALGEDVFAQAYRSIVQLGRPPELVVLLFCNAPTIVAETIDAGVEGLRADPSVDSAVTVSCYNMWSPVRARRIGANGLLEPFVPFEAYQPFMAISCDRDAQGDVYFADMSVSIVRPRCLEDLSYGVLPQRWMGQRILPLRQWGGLDVDYPWQVPLVEYWLRAHGFSDERTPYDVPAGRQRWNLSRDSAS